MAGNLREQLDELRARAQEQTSARRWSAAASSWELLLEQAEELELVDLVLEARLQAADAWRRDDRPSESLAVLEPALDLVDGEARASLGAWVCACLLDLGRPDLAETAALEALSEAGEGDGRLVLLDTLAGALVATGRTDDLVPLVEELEARARGLAMTSAWFRRAQLERLRGELEVAAEGFARCALALRDQPHAVGASAAAVAELAELELLRGEPALALDLVARAEGDWEAAGRQAGAAQAWVSRALAALSAGARVMPGALERAIEHARGRGLVALEAKALLARGLALGLDADLDAALALAEAAGLRPLAGRVRLERFQRGWSADPELLLLAADELSGDMPWYCRATLALAEALEHHDPAESMRLAARVSCRFAVMGMEFEEARARDLLRRARV